MDDVSPADEFEPKEGKAGNVYFFIRKKWGNFVFGICPTSKTCEKRYLILLKRLSEIREENELFRGKEANQSGKIVYEASLIK